MNYWQIAAGSDEREYSKEFLRFGMAFVGSEFEQTMSRLAVGDRVILKSGKSIAAVGEVVQRNGRHFGCEDKPWLNIDGWDLGAWCYVDWRVLTTPIRANALTRTTIQNVWDQQLRDQADSLFNTLPLGRPPAPEPTPTHHIEDKELLEFLIAQGLRAQAADELATALNRIRLLSNYYTRYAWNSVGEHEGRTFLVVPLLIALGWAEQQLKIELAVSGGHIDIACYDRPFATKNAQCILLIETKSLRQGLSYAPQQAMAYAKHFPECKVILVSNGYCYKAYKRDAQAPFPDKPYAYLNLLDPRNRYPLDPENVDGSLETLRLLLPHNYL